MADKKTHVVSDNRRLTELVKLRTQFSKEGQGRVTKMEKIAAEYKKLHEQNQKELEKIAPVVDEIRKIVHEIMDPLLGKYEEIVDTVLDTNAVSVIISFRDELENYKEFLDNKKEEEKSRQVEDEERKEEDEEIEIGSDIPND